MNITKRVAVALTGAVALLTVTAGQASADTVGPAVSYFKAPIPVICGTLSDSSGTPSFSIKDGWSVNDGDGICSASTEIYRSGVGYSSIWNFSGNQSVKRVTKNYGWTTRIGQYQSLRTRATDCLGNTGSGYEYISPSLDQQGSASFGAGWSTGSCLCWSGGSVFHSSRVGATATYSFSGRLVSLVTARASNRGKVSLSVDGGPATVVSLTGPTLNRVIAWNSKYLSSGTHLLTIKVVSGRVDVDGFITQG